MKIIMIEGGFRLGKITYEDNSIQYVTLQKLEARLDDLFYWMRT